MSDDLINAIRLFEGININVSNNYSSTYLFSTENIRGFSNKLPLKNNNVLTVCSSGDQAFNFILNGAKKVDLFDINIFTKYYFYLKKAAIMALSYDEFLDFFFNKKRRTQNSCLYIYLSLRKFINDDEIRLFWDYLFSKYQNNIFYNSNFIYNINYKKNSIIQYNDYLLNEDNYNKLKKNLTDSNFNFYSTDIFSELVPSDNKYDIVYLSNIFDYLIYKDDLKFYNKIKEIIKNFDSISNDDRIIINYLYCYYDAYWDVSKISTLKSLKFRTIFFENDVVYIPFKGYSSLSSNVDKNLDAVMIHKKTK